MIFATVTGNLGADPELRTLQNGDTVVNMSIASSKRYKGRDGEWHSQTTWIRASAWGDFAKVFVNHFKKGDSILLLGELSEEKYTDRENVERTAIKLDIQRFQFMGKKEDPSESDPAPVRSPPPKDEEGAEEGVDDDLPF